MENQYLLYAYKAGDASSEPSKTVGIAVASAHFTKMALALNKRLGDLTMTQDGGVLQFTQQLKDH